MSRTKRTFDTSKYTEGKLLVTKLGAAVSQLETAITLWFFDGDPCSICTLTFAAAEIISVLNREAKGQPMLIDGSSDVIRPEFQEEFRSIIREGPNFLKHGSKDPAGTYFLPVRNACILLLDAVIAYNHLGHSRRPLFQLLQSWVAIQNPEFFTAHTLSDAERLDALAKGKAAFYNWMLPIFTRQFSAALGPGR